MPTPRKQTSRTRASGELKYRAALQVVSDIITENRESTARSLRAAKDLKKMYKEKGIPWTREINNQGLGARKAGRFFVMLFTRIRKDMRKAARDAQRKDRDDRRKSGMVR